MIKVLIISINAIGDTYLSLSALKPLKNKFNEIEFSFLINSQSEFLFENLEIKNILITEKNIHSILKTYFQLKGIQFDYIFSFFPGVVNTFFYRILKSKNKGGFINYLRKSQWYDTDAKVTIKNDKGNTSKKLLWKKNENYLRRVELILTEFKIGFEKISKYKYNHIGSSKYSNAIVLHPFSRDVERSMSIEQLIYIANFILNEMYLPFYIIGNKKILELKKYLPSETNFFVKPSMLELVNLVNAKLFISVDSFPLHIADAYNTHFVGLFSNTLSEAVLINSAKSIKFETTDLRRVETKKIIEQLTKYLT